MSEAHALSGLGPVERHTARILSEGPPWRVQTEAGTLRATVAASCLVRPEQHDLVVVEVLPDGRGYIATVLERGDTPVELTVPGDLHIRSEGRLGLSSRAGVDVASRAVALTAGQVDVRTIDAHVAATHLRFLGRTMESSLERVRSFAGTCEQVADRMSQRVKRAFRRVDELDQLHAGRIDHRAEQTMSLRGRETLMTASRLVKVDGEQVHLG